MRRTKNSPGLKKTMTDILKSRGLHMEVQIYVRGELQMKAQTRAQLLLDMKIEFGKKATLIP